MINGAIIISLILNYHITIVSYCDAIYCLRKEKLKCTFRCLNILEPVLGYGNCNVSPRLLIINTFSN